MIMKRSACAGFVNDPAVTRRELLRPTKRCEGRVIDAVL
jgi:hypothetical protein